MPFRFRKSLKITKGLKLNVSKSGISTSIGGKGASLNIGKRGIRKTVGIPGTGISHSSNLVPQIKTPRRKAQTITSPQASQTYQQPRQTKPFPWMTASKVAGIFIAAFVFLCFACLAFGIFLEIFFPSG
jgi:hypothetical protein